MKKWTIKFAPMAAAVILGCLLTLGYAPYDVFPLGIIAPAGLLYLWMNATPQQAFWRGFAFGTGNFATGIYWIYHSIHVIGGIPAPIAVLITTGFIFILSIFPAASGYFLNRYFPTDTGIKQVFAFPALWTLFDMLRSMMFTGFPWLFVGYTQVSSPLAGYATVCSVFGVTIVSLMCSALLLNAYLYYTQNNKKLAMGSLLAVALFFVGGKTLEMIQWTSPIGKPRSIALVQGNISQTLKWSPDHLKLSLDRYRELTDPLYGKEDFIIWPEAAVPVALQYAESYLTVLNEKALDSGTNLILGIPVQNEKGDGYYNSVITLGSTHQIYNKRHLVPFGEYTPELPFLNQAMNFLNIPMSESVNGKLNQKPMTVDGMKILVNVCYEIAYPELIRNDVISDPNLGFVLTVTNDAWFGRTNAQAQHLQIAQMRAIELGRSVVFSSNDGITAIIDPKGVISAQAPAYVPFVLTGDVQAMHGLTPWMKEFGNQGYKYLIIVFLIFAAHEAITKRRAIKNQAILESNI